MWGTISFWLRFAAALWAAGVGVVVGLQAAEIVPRTPKLEATVWVVSLAIIGVDNVGTLIVRRLRRGRTQRQSALEKALMGMLVLMSATEQVRFEQLGASVYVPSRLNWIRRRRQKPEQLKRILRYRPSQTPQQSGIQWTSATGVVGACWTHQAKQYKNTYAIAAKYNGAMVLEEQFKGMPKVTRGGFTREQFNAIAGKYSEIHAEPIWHPQRERKLIGVMTIDRAFHSNGATFRAEFERNGLTDQAALTAKVVANALRPERAED